MIKKRIIAVMLVAIVLLCGCTKSHSNANTAKISESYRMAKTDDLISEEESATLADIFIELYKANAMTGEDNVMISPLSIAMALCMTANGTTGETLDEFADFFGIEPEKLSVIFNKFISSLDEKKLKIANSVWYKNSGFTINDEFVKECVELFGADMFTSNMDADTVKDINNWVKDKTDGMIDKIIGKLTDDDIMVLLNALSFDAKWSNPYEDIQVKKDIFTMADGSKVNVDFLNSIEKEYVENENFTGFMKSYAGGRYDFLALLPKDEGDIKESIKTLDGKTFIELIHSSTSDYDVRASLPKFESDYDMSQKDILQSLGLKKAFRGSTDFNKMGDIPDGVLGISNVLHKTHIEVNEGGTRAAAATAVVVSKESAAINMNEIKYVILNRPFVYAIIDNYTGLPLFVGTIDSLQ